MSETNFPKHLGLILDGNRRFAKKLMLKPWQGHEFGAKKLRKVLTWCKDFDIKELTVYGLSIENLKRPKEEFNYLMKIFKETFDELVDDPEINDNGIKINFMGSLHLLPENIQEAIKVLEENTKNNSNYLVNIALAYGGRNEIIDAARRIAMAVKEGKIKPSEVNNKLFEKHLYTSDEPDMIIRTGGEKRSSNFMCYQSAYSEWFYLEKTWPEFEKEDLNQCIEEFTKRKRRYGK